MEDFGPFETPLEPRVASSPWLLAVGLDASLVDLLGGRPSPLVCTAGAGTPRVSIGSSVSSTRCPSRGQTGKSSAMEPGAASG